MKIRIFIALLLALLIAELIWLAGKQEASYEAACQQYVLDTAAIEQRRESLTQKQAELDAITNQEAQALEHEAAQLQAEAQALQDSVEALPNQMAALETQMAELQQEYAEVEEDYKYYMEVYDALAEGLEKVEGYIAGN